MALLLKQSFLMSFSLQFQRPQFNESLVDLTLRAIGFADLTQFYVVTMDHPDRMFSEKLLISMFEQIRPKLVELQMASAEALGNFKSAAASAVHVLKRRLSQVKIKKTDLWAPDATGMYSEEYVQESVQRALSNIEQ